MTSNLNPAVMKNLETSAFLRLPTELRLEIYASCSTFTLLQLSHTSSHLYLEINSIPKVYQSAFGYRSPAKTKKQIETSQPTLTVNNICQLTPPEYTLFNKIWHTYTQDGGTKTRTRYACGKCRLMYHYSHFVVDNLEILKWKMMGKLVSDVCKLCQKEDEFVVLVRKGYGTGLGLECVF